MKRKKMSAISIHCPHCHHPVRAIKTRNMSNLMKEITYLCQNARCAHVYVASLEVLRTVSLSAQPDLSLRIPISQQIGQSAVLQLANQQWDVARPSQPTHHHRFGLAEGAAL
jgi:hypothetical protein